MLRVMGEMHPVCREDEAVFGKGRASI